MIDKRLVGQWYREQMGETIDIFDEVPLRMKLSFETSGHYHFEPNCVYEEDGFFCYEINGEYHRAVYRVKYADGKLEGVCTQYGTETALSYVKTSDTPEDKPYEALPMEQFVPHTKERRIDVLRRYAGYDRSREYGSFVSFALGGEIPEILQKYDYQSYIEGVNPGSDEIAFRLLDFVCDHFGHNGTKALGAGRTIVDLITYCEQNDGKVNCRGLAILLASLLRLNNIKAQHITCMPCEEPFYDCHVVVDCLLPSGKRVMLDPSYRVYFKDQNGEYVSLPALRELLVNDEPIFESPAASYNGQGFSKEYYRNYMTKNCFRFSRATLAAQGVDGQTDQSRHLELVPVGYATEQTSTKRKTECVFNDIEFWEL